ncbi:MAG: hemolysin activation protein [Prevotellaceae bacterium]|nr:hemolysin activation protein [Prevotellaceae bacterium]
MKQPARIDIAVLILFFNRPEQLKGVFDEVRKARPSRLFLYQDGPRDERDLPGIEACRRIVEDIDWECRVERKYQTRNYGCDPSEFISQKWAFSMADKCIVLEDDDIPSQSFFPFCKEMLDRYEHDRRISMVAGINYDEVTPDMPYDYFFATTFSISGWASWRRVVDQWDEHYTFLDDSFNLRQLEAYIKDRRYQQDFIRFCRYHRSLGKAYYETIFHAAIFFSSGLSIVPRVNMINNAGATGEGVHLSGSNDDLPRAIRRIFTMKRHELSFPLKHPRYVIENVEYKHRMFRIMAWGHPWIKFGRSFEELWINLRRGNLRRIAGAVANRLRILAGRQRFD